MKKKSVIWKISDDDFIKLVNDGRNKKRASWN